jgi:hypothetical protein
VNIQGQGTQFVRIGDEGFPSPTVSVYEERMHSWVAMPKDIEHIS